MEIKLKEVNWIRKEDGSLEGRFIGYDHFSTEPKIIIKKQKDLYWWYYYTSEDYDDVGIADTEDNAKRSSLDVIKNIIENELSYDLRICNYERLKVII